MIKIYIHHFFTKELFLILAHNTTNREYDIKDKTGIVRCNYKNTNFEFVFEPTINNNEDGFHLLDWYTALKQQHINENFIFNKQIYENNESLPFLERIKDILIDKKNWIITYFRTEKIFVKNESVHSLISEKEYKTLLKCEEYLESLNNQIVITDNLFLN